MNSITQGNAEILVNELIDQFPKYKQMQAPISSFIEDTPFENDAYINIPTINNIMFHYHCSPGPFFSNSARFL